MKTHKRALIIMTAAGLLLVALSGAVSARTYWVKGIVTKSPWTETYKHIEVDNVKYTIMPQDIRIERRFETSGGVWKAEDISLIHIRAGQTILMRIQGHRVYQIVIED